MTIPIVYTKASGAGNDFVLVNDLAGNIRVDFARLARAACDRHFGVGGDGLLVLQESSRADFTMLYYNADGSSGGMCGNGGRCIARFAYLEGVAGKSQHFEALDYLYEAEVGESSVRLHMKDTQGIRKDLRFSVPGGEMAGTFIDTGAPHAVIFVEEIDRLDVMSIGRGIRYDPMFAPSGTNVNFVRIGSGSTIAIRTYERGVESETMACGTGSVASALVSSEVHSLASPVTVAVRSGESLTVRFTKSGLSWTDISLDGSAHMLFTGTMLYHQSESTIRLIP